MGTRPTEGLVELGNFEKAPDLLIHEGTMEHHLIEDAIKKRHSTFTEAIQQGMNCGAKNTVITHFSQRYAKFPTFEEFRDVENVAFAFDHLRMSPEDLTRVRSLMDPLGKIFPKDFSKNVSIKNSLCASSESEENSSPLETEPSKKRKRDHSLI